MAPDADAVARRIEELQKRSSAPELPAPAASELGTEQMRSLVVLETDPPGAQAHIFRPRHVQAAPFRPDGTNPDWEEIVTATTPANLSLSVGEYHVAIDKFAGFNASDTPLRVSAGHVHHFKANLSQGVFMAFLRVSSNVRGARIWLDSKDRSGPEWGTAPYAELVPVGKHTVFVEAPGFEPAHQSLSLSNGERRNVHVDLVRVGYGFVAVEAGDIAEARVSLDGRVVGTWRKGQPPLSVRAPAGVHSLSVEARGHKDFEGEVRVPRGQVLPVKIRLIPKYPRGTAWAQAAVSAALIGTGVVLGLESENIAQRVETERDLGSLQSDDPRLVRGKWFAIGADVSFAAGALMAGLATWNFLRDPLPESSLTQRPVREFEPGARAEGGALRVTAGGTPRAFALQFGGTF
jgi:hypothetical protein